MIKFKLDHFSGVPLYRQIIDQILYGIASGALAYGEQLPTVRALAVELAINPNTVRKAYNELEIRGILSTHQGTGTFIATEHYELPEEERVELVKKMVSGLISGAMPCGISAEELLVEFEKQIDEFTDKIEGREE
jgi:GntR family transcriptional regulator